MSEPSIGVFYNATIRNNGTARRFWDALVRMGYKEHGLVRYSRPAGIDIKDHNLHIFVDDGRDDIDEFPPSPNACWLIDTHLGYDKRLEWARKFDNVFLAQVSDVDKMKKDGIKNVYWLPLACSPELDVTASQLVQANMFDYVPDTEWDTIFVGFINGGPPDGDGNNRLEYLDYIFKHIQNSWLALDKFFLEASARVCKARTIFNVSIKRDLNMRFFEGMSYGRCLVTNVDVDGWEELGFRKGVHFLGYQGMEEAVEKIKWACSNPMAREVTARDGYEFVRAEHTYKHRVEQMLNQCGVV